MKPYLIPALLMLATALTAQFKVNGTITGYHEKPVLIKIYENGTPRLVQRTETDKNGVFSYHHPVEYTGKVIFEIVQGGFESVTANSDIRFITNLNDPIRGLNYTDDINLAVQHAFELEDKKALKDYTLVELLKMYRPGDTFYQALQNEIARIGQLEKAEVENEAIAYYINAKNDIALYNGNKLAHSEILNGAKNHLVKDNMYLENFGLLQDFLSIYISYSLSEASSREDAGRKLEVALDQLLEETSTDSSRGQAVLTAIIPMLEGNGFDTQAAKYLTQAGALTCEITPELRNLIQGKNNITTGAEVPDISFGKKINGAESLYDVKADQKLIVFWASWCPHCMNELPHLKTFYPGFKAKGGEIIAVSLDMERDAFENAVNGTSWINYSDLLKWESPLVSKFGITSTPTMILVDKNNRVIKTGSRISEFL